MFHILRGALVSAGTVLWPLVRLAPPTADCMATALLPRSLQVCVQPRAVCVHLYSHAHAHAHATGFVAKYTFDGDGATGSLAQASSITGYLEKLSTLAPCTGTIKKKRKRPLVVSFM